MATKHDKRVTYDSSDLKRGLFFIVDWFRGTPDFIQFHSQCINVVSLYMYTIYMCIYIYIHLRNDIS